jgi:NADH dehydrogenase (ubiquinone) 1 alpha/beta subcomplex 1
MSLLRLVGGASMLARYAPAARSGFSRPLAARYSAVAGLSRSDIERRVLDVLKGFEKVEPSKVCTADCHLRVQSAHRYPQLSTTSSFTKDLGLDSLDAVEVVMAVEEVSFLSFTFCRCCHNLILPGICY